MMRWTIFTKMVKVISLLEGSDMWVILSRDVKTTREELLESLAKQDTQIIALAYAHAQYLKMYGIDIEKALHTATENAEVITRAYQRGYYDAMEKVSRNSQASDFLAEARACAESEEQMEGYKPLTPSFRTEIDDAFDRQIEELKTCEPNTLVMVQISALQAYKNLIHGLPDGYPIPIRK